MPIFTLMTSSTLNIICVYTISMLVGKISGVSFEILSANTLQAISSALIYEPGYFKDDQ